MDKNEVQNQKNTVFNHNLIMNNREKLSMSGIKKVISINTENINCQLSQTSIAITGKDLHIEKLDVDTGNIEIVGQINCIKYQVQKQGLIKRIFG